MKQYHIAKLKNVVYNKRMPLAHARGILLYQGKGKQSTL